MLNVKLNELYRVCIVSLKSLIVGFFTKFFLGFLKSLFNQVCSGMPWEKTSIIYILICNSLLVLRCKSSWKSPMKCSDCLVVMCFSVVQCRILVTFKIFFLSELWSNLSSNKWADITMILKGLPAFHNTRLNFGQATSLLFSAMRVRSNKLWNKQVQKLCCSLFSTYK